MNQADSQLEGCSFTSFGIKEIKIWVIRQSKIQAKELTASKRLNVTNQLVGKAAGVMSNWIRGAFTGSV
jgi:hypothetical protein